MFSSIRSEKSIVKALLKIYLIFVIENYTKINSILYKHRSKCNLYNDYFSCVVYICYKCNICLSNILNIKPN